MAKLLWSLIWLAVTVLGVTAVATIALHRGEQINAMWLVVAAFCTYAIGYRFYSKFIAARVLALDAKRATPSERLNNGRDFVPSNKWVVFGHHFAAIAGPGPLVGSGVGRPVWLSTGHFVDTGRRCFRGLRPGFCDPSVFRPP